MKPRAGLLATVLIFSHFGSGKELKPDRTISITSVEHRESNTSKPYKVEIRFPGKESVLENETTNGTA